MRAAVGCGTLEGCLRRRRARPSPHPDALPVVAAASGRGRARRGPWRHCSGIGAGAGAAGLRRGHRRRDGATAPLGPGRIVVHAGHVRAGPEAVYEADVLGYRLVGGLGVGDLHRRACWAGSRSSRPRSAPDRSFTLVGVEDTATGVVTWAYCRRRLRRRPARPGPSAARRTPSTIPAGAAPGPVEAGAGASCRSTAPAPIWRPPRARSRTRSGLPRPGVAARPADPRPTAERQRSSMRAVRDGAPTARQPRSAAR